MASLSLHLRALALLTASRLMLRSRGTTATLRGLTGKGRSQTQLEPARAMYAVRRVSRLVGGKCLPQAVALTALLRRGGYDPILVLGCQRTTERAWTAHAWVKLGSETLEPVRANKHQALAYLGSATGWTPSPLRETD